MSIKRKKHSHKGDNGRVLVIGGNEEFHGAPIFAALGAEATGVDLVRLVVPKSQKTLARKWSLNFIVSTFAGEYLRASDVAGILKLARKSDVLVMGMGLGTRKETVNAIKQIIRKTSCKLVIDADGLAGITQMLKREVVVTPHIREVVKLLEQIRNSNIEIRNKFSFESEPEGSSLRVEDQILNFKFQNCESLNFRKLVAKQISALLGVTTVLKGVIDVVCSPEGRIKLSRTGNAGMTVGGTGDALAGVIGGLMAQGMSGEKAGYLAVQKLGEAGDRLQKKKGFRFTAEEVAKNISL